MLVTLPWGRPSIADHDLSTNQSGGVLSARAEPPTAPNVKPQAAMTAIAAPVRLLPEKTVPPIRPGDFRPCQP